ncbi:hypothetical protein CLIB1423_09S01552 [[Candida] railenensis]|uniref:Transcription factor CBF/NF-Y/archaeal histone domain-containing protein n=1 Tax=[Candida] railenensis TaxID=45579 RepID=A0A9P0QQI2_9ASCO|nr:hypothetical protein CLIB1423_09S01552 [[Candida] railenensis]
MDPNSINPHEVELREQDRWLPIANVARLMKNTLPPTAKVSKDAKECMQECVSEFISFITSEASDKCLREKRKTINGEDILYSMHDLGFENYAEVLKIYLAKYREQQALKQERGETRSTKRQNMASILQQQHESQGQDQILSPDHSQSASDSAINSPHSAISQQHRIPQQSQLQSQHEQDIDTANSVEGVGIEGNVEVEETGVTIGAQGPYIEDSTHFTQDPQEHYSSAEDLNNGSNTNNNENNNNNNSNNNVNEQEINIDDAEVGQLSHTTSHQTNAESEHSSSHGTASPKQYYEYTENGEKKNIDEKDESYHYEDFINEHNPQHHAHQHSHTNGALAELAESLTGDQADIDTLTADITRTSGEYY